MLAKRLFDLFFVLPGLVLLSPLFLIIAIAIKLDSRGSIFFKQIRVGLHGRHFQVFKFRTMVMNAEEKGDKVTIEGDARITKVGYFLREYKFDELPQLLNVLIGTMSLVGPRPEVPEYVDFYSSAMKKIVLSVPPGMTDRASIEFRDENKILAGSINPVKDYREKVLPIKLDYYKQYVQQRSLWLDFSLIIGTFSVIIR
ncbi:MAG: sugar transferase [Cocleimonas sp.]|nr:sugar transferase [Cocleimonas sp.]